MTLKLFKPINILDSRGYWPDRGAIVDAIGNLLALGLVGSPFPVRDFGRYRDMNWRDSENKLRPYQSVDWFVFDSLNEDRFQVDCVRMLECFEREPWRREELLGDHYDLFVLEEDMFDPDVDDAREPYQVGSARPLVGAVVSTHRIDSIWGDPYSYLKTEVMRQLCFMFGLPDRGRSDVQVFGGQVYCRNRCILRRAVTAPCDWEQFTFDRLCCGALCASCLVDLRLFLARADKERRLAEGAFDITA
jgi:hypothetical protein